MKFDFKFKKNNVTSLPSNRIATMGGSYSLIITAILLAIILVLNILVNALPTNLTKYDISSSQLYSITSNTKVVVNALEQDVTIYWIVQADSEDDIIENLLGKYESLSDHIEVVKKNPDVYPTFAEQYTDEVIENNSLIVESGEKSRYIAYSDIFIEEADMYSYSYTTSFDGEGAITSAIDYVVAEELPKLYTLEGHGEAELPSTFADQLEKENIETETLSLLNIDEIPEDADCIMIYAPTSDLSQEECNMLTEYADNGGKLLVMAGPVEDDNLSNLYNILPNYGVESVDGIVVEEDRNYYAFGYPYVLMPEIASHEITDSLIAENYYAIMPISRGMYLTENAGENVTELLTTSVTAFNKSAGFALESYEFEEGDEYGPFALAVSIETNMEGQIIWFSSSDFLYDMYNAYSSGANNDLAANALSSLIGEREAIAIRSKSLNYNYLTISDSTASTLQILMIGVFPLVYLGIGICIAIARKKVQHEAV